MTLHWTAWATLVALVVYIWILMNVGKARGKFKIQAPTTDGPVEFQSVLRVQANTVEMMVVFFPALWLCAYFENDMWAAVGGIAWSIGRVVYAVGYYKDPAKRSAGFGITALATIALMLGAAWGLLTH
jgi:glutathione S-transferase